MPSGIDTVDFSESRLIQTTEGKPKTEYPITVLELD